MPWWLIVLQRARQIRRRLVVLLMRTPPKPVEPPPVIPEPPPPPVHHENRKARRARSSMERQREKLDKFVTPKGPQPVSIPRGVAPKRERKPEPAPAPEVDSANFWMAGNDGTPYRDSELWGLFSFRDTILDQLDRYWIYLRRMKRHEPHTYGFYRQVGATIVPMATWFLQDGLRDVPKKDREHTIPELSPWWKQNRPMFGCVSYGISSRIEQEELSKSYANGKKKIWVPKFLYFIKYKSPPPEIQPTTGGDVYKMTIWWDRPHDPKTAKRLKGGTPDEYAVYVSADGTDVHVLPMLTTQMVPIPKRKNGMLSFDIPQRCWNIPRHFVEWAKTDGTDANTFLSRLFVEAAHTVERAAYSVVRIAVHKNDLTAIFGVEVKRLAYFFQDRDITLTENGVKQRIFHIVRAHVRKDGTGVPFHFRGLREFDWAGYRVEITVPQRDHFMPHDVDIGAVDEYWDTKKEKMIFMPQVGKKLVEYMHAGIGKTNRRAR